MLHLTCNSTAAVLLRYTTAGDVHDTAGLRYAREWAAALD